jgi:hypothetical protein
MRIDTVVPMQALLQWVKSHSLAMCVARARRDRCSDVLMAATVTGSFTLFRRLYSLLPSIHAGTCRMPSPFLDDIQPPPLLLLD